MTARVDRPPRTWASLTGATVWGFCEATFFFIIPDVFLTRIAVRRPHRVVAPVLAALAGALVGGWLMFQWGEPARPWVDAVPAVSTEMIDRVGESLREDGVVAMVLGPLTGTPYKVYAFQARSAGMTPARFLVGSVLARAPRFLVIAFVAAWLSRRFGARLSERRVITIWAVVWIVNYVVYFTLKGW